MTTELDAPPTPRWQMPRLSQNRIVGGVAAGIAEEVGVDPLVIRISFIVLAAAGGWGVLLYGSCWLVMYLAGNQAPEVAGTRTPKASSETNRLLGVGLVVLGLLLFFRDMGVGFVDSLVWPIALFGAGVAIAHHQGVELGLSRTSSSVAGPDRSAFLVRVAGGSILVLAGVGLAISLNFSFGTVLDTMLVMGIVVAGLGLVLGPWVVGLVNDLAQERRARIRSEERADVAAHLHDSVLQTLSLIQRRADDPQVVGLARKQERELRNWLYGPDQAQGMVSFRVAVETELAEVEELNLVPVEVVVVGDCDLDEDSAAVVAATREAVTNASVHSGAPTVDVFAEVGKEHIDVFVRDTGTGFNLDAVPEDRRGIAQSIVGRMERAGGAVTINSEPGNGTEVEIHLDRTRP